MVETALAKLAKKRSLKFTIVKIVVRMIEKETFTCMVNKLLITEKAIEKCWNYS